MLTRRIIVTLTINGGSLYRTKLFRPDRLYTMNFVDMEVADELVMLDVTRPGGWDEASWDRMRLFADDLFLPLAVGGGITTVERARHALREVGADKVVVNTEAVRRPEFIGELARHLGSQSVVVSVDVSDGEVVIDRGRERTGRRALDWVCEAEDRGAGEIYLMSMDRDGSLEGYDLPLLGEVAEAVSVPVVISGGCGCWAHMWEGFDAGADACSTSVIHHFTGTSLRAAKDYLAQRGLNMRMA